MSYFDQRGPADHKYMDTSQPLMPYPSNITGQALMGTGTYGPVPGMGDYGPVPGTAGFGDDAIPMYAPPGYMMIGASPPDLASFQNAFKGSSWDASIVAQGYACSGDPPSGTVDPGTLMITWAGQGLFVVAVKNSYCKNGWQLKAMPVANMVAAAGMAGMFVVALPGASTPATQENWAKAMPPAAAPPGPLTNPPGTFITPPVTAAAVSPALKLLLGALVVGGLLWLVLGKKKAFTANGRRRRLRKPFLANKRKKRGKSRHKRAKRARRGKSPSQGPAIFLRRRKHKGPMRRGPRGKMRSYNARGYKYSRSLKGIAKRGEMDFYALGKHNA